MSTVESGRLGSVRHLFVLAAAIEAVAGLTLLAAPAVVLRMVFGPAGDTFPAAGIARLAGAALLSFAAACWWARHEERSETSKALVGAMLIYNIAVVALCVAGSLGAVGPLQWAAVALHGALSIWCAWVLANGIPAATARASDNSTS